MTLARSLRTVWRDPRFAADRGRAAYVARVFLAVAIALWLAAWLQLRNVQSAVTTVLIVVNPSVGALISKSLWRIFGTILGAVVAIAAFAGFAQSPLLFDVLLAVWVGLCCLASTLLRYFRAYGAVLAGYTLVIVAAPALNAPDTIITSALSRLSVVVIGIVVAAVVFLLTTPQPRVAPVLARVRTLAAGAAGLLDVATTFPADPIAQEQRVAASRRALVGGLAGIDEALEFMPPADARMATALTYLRLACTRLTGTLSATPTLGRASAWLHPFEPFDRETWPRPARIEAEAMGVAGAALAAVAAMGDETVAARDALAEAKQKLTALSSVLSAPDPAMHPDEPADGPWRSAELRALAITDLLILLMARFEDVLTAMIEVVDGVPGMHEPLRLRGFHDWRTAIRNGVRGALTSLICCAFWYVTEWPDGMLMLTFVVPAASLLATAPSAGKVATEFAIGTAISAVVGVFSVDVLLPQAVGYWQIVLAVFLPIAPGLWFQFHPKWGRIATGYTIFFSAQLGVQNPLRLDLATSLNSALAFLVGSAVLVLVFRVLLPPDDLRETRRLSRTLARSVERCAAPTGWLRRYLRHGFNRGALWEHWHTQVIMRLTDRAASLPPALRRDVLEASMSSVLLGRALLRLQDMMADIPADRQAPVIETLAAARHLSRDPAAAGRVARRASFAVPMALAAGSDETVGSDDAVPTFHRVAATLRQIGDLLEAYPEFYDRAGPLQGLFVEVNRLRLTHMLPLERA